MTQPFVQTVQCYGDAYFVGDIHGEYHQLMRALAHLGFDAERGDLLFSVGDIIDRGHYSVRCLELLEKPWFYAVKGNHEAMMIASLQGDLEMQQIWQRAGGDWYQQLKVDQQLRLKQHFLPKLEALPIALEVNLNQDNLTLAVIHADLPFEDWQTFKQQPQLDEAQLATCLWSRSTLKAMEHGRYPSRIAGVDALIMGHTPMPMFRGHGNRVWLDTGAGYPNGNLSVLSARHIVHLLLR